MASVRVRIDDLERGDIPALSAKTGVACANPVAIVLRPEQRPWSPTGPRISAILPLEPARARSRRLLTRTAWTLLAVGAAALLAALTGAGSAVVLIAIAAFAAYLVLVFVGERRWIGSKPSDHDGEVLLTRVHRDFARSVDQQYGR
jgi:hypothetical protein